MNPMNKALLLILDGWGEGKKDRADAIFHANTPFVDHLKATVPTSFLKTYGNHVGLPEGQMGNSEVGHLNIGAGRVVWQMLVRINRAFAEKTIKEMETWQTLINLLKNHPDKTLHIMGLVSDGGVHSHQDHLVGLCQILQEEGLDQRTTIHAFTDGRDTDPNSGLGSIQTITEAIGEGECQIASICGRYYAMDRDNRWERTSKAWKLLVEGEGRSFSNYSEAMNHYYQEGITDEFMEPIRLEVPRPDQSTISSGDVVLCFNFRTDRARQITKALTQVSLHEHGMHTLDLDYFTMTEYDKEFQNVSVLFENKDLEMTLGEVVSKAGLTQLRAAETEKYPHVTFFFSGGREKQFPGEKRLLVNSPKVATYDLQPEMSAPELTEKACDIIEAEQPDFICLNYANPDMVGHTGIYEAIMKACETVDAQAKKLVETAQKWGYHVLIIADHGNADNAVNEDGSPNTAHSVNPVPAFLISDKQVKMSDGKLADVAPTLLELMDLKQPTEMDGKSLLELPS
jgi:2,3-bisphosphoglycerate-independent phosphoglycerate mutase